jgi:glycosyltransferase involved in cell wall biosynthesis
MKILLIGEYSNVHATLAIGLREMGHQVTVISNGDFWKNYPRDIDVTRQTGKWGGIRLIVKLWTLLPKMRGYDVVQLINPMFFELKAERLEWFYNYLQRNNKCIVLGGYGMDYYWVNTCCSEMPLRYSDFNIGNELRTDEDALKERRDWLGTAKERLNRRIAESCNGIVTGLYEYHVCYAPKFPHKTYYIPFPIKMQDTIEAAKTHNPVKIFIGISKNRSTYKGTDIMLKAAEDVARNYPDRMILEKVEGVPFGQYQYLMDNSDVILDQLYSYTPSMNSLLAMSKGIVVIGGGEPENYEILHEKELRPIINVEPSYESVYHQLEWVIQHPEEVERLKAESIAYVKKHHNCQKVAKQYEAMYEALLQSADQ